MFGLALGIRVVGGQVNPEGVDERERPPDGALVDQLLGEPHRGQEALLLVDGVDEAAGAGAAQHSPGLGERRGQGLGAEHVLAGVERRQGDRRVLVRGRDHGHRVDRRLRQEHPVVAVGSGHAEFGRDLGGAGRVGAADGNHLRAGVRAEGADVLLAKAGADDGDAHASVHRWSSVFPSILA